MPLILCSPYNSSQTQTADPFQSNVSTLIKIGGSGSNTIVDSKENTVTVVGNVQVSNTITKFGSSASFDGTSGYLNLGNTPGRLGNGDFTVEVWLYILPQTSVFPTVFSNYSVWGTGTGEFALFVGHASSDRTRIQVSFNGTFPAINSTQPYVKNAWTHVAVVRSNGVVTLYLDGQANGTYTSSKDLVGNGNISWIGNAGDSSSQGFYKGYMEEFRITKGVARYTGNFIPPSLPFSTN